MLNDIAKLNVFKTPKIENFMHKVCTLYST